MPEPRTVPTGSRRGAGTEPTDLPPLQGDGLPTLPTGEPVLQRWFVVVLLVMVPVTLAVTVWAFMAIDREPLSAAERRPAGGPEVTIARGEAMLSETRDAEPGPGCSQAIRVVGDPGSQTAARAALEGVCDLIDTGDFPELREGLVTWIARDGQLRVATFELSGVESSARVEDDRLVVELNAKFQFEDPRRGSPALVHQLVLLTDPGWPGETVSVTTELRAAALQQRACDVLELGAGESRGCRDAAELLAADDPVADLLDVGFRDDR
ncbi:MAG: hypothetical protein EA387_04390 [Nitriliruptor sp.]|nr:MAG: hypothetical protein EA387_04390 [Nitriliruptor sp.]